MGKKTRTNIIIITVFIVIALVTVAMGLFLADALPARISYTINNLLSKISVPQNTDPVISSNYFDETELSVLPEDFYAVFLDIDSDISTSPESTYGTLVNEAAAYFETFKNVLADSVFIKPDISGKYSSFKDVYGNAVDVLREIMSHAEEKNYFTVLYADDDILYDEDGNMSFEKIKYYISNYSFDAVYICGEKLINDEKMSEAAVFYGKRLKESFEDKFMGIKARSVQNGSEYASSDSKNALGCEYLDFAVVDAGGSIKSSPSFSTVLKWWNELSYEYANTRFLCLHRVDLVCSNNSDWSSNLEISDQFRTLWDCERITGHVFFDASAIRKNTLNSMQRFAFLLYDGDTSISDLKVTALTVDDKKNTVKFSGTSPSGHKLILNGTVANQSGGFFNLEYMLNPGLNKYVFYSCGQEHTYRIFNNDGSAVQTDYEDKYSPFTDNGLGRALMCRIVNDNTETLGTPGEKNTYHADYSTLTEGTLDYVKNITVSKEGYIRYELRSGVAVYGVNCELINNAYVLPENSIIAERVDDSSPDSTDLYFSTDWFVPVTVKCNPQTYYRGYQDYSFNISSFTAEYVEIKFAETNHFYNISNLQFAENSVFSHSELYADTAGNMLLRLYLKKPGQFYGFNIKHIKNEIVVSCKKHSDGYLTGKVVMLDPGHGGFSMTGTAFNNQIAEKDVTLSIALKAKQMLEANGATVIMTREIDSPLTLQERNDLTTSIDPDIFVSIHCDGTDSAAESGTHTFYFRPYSMPLAKSIHECMVSIYRNYIYAPTDTNYASIDRGIKYYPFYVTRMNNCPAVLCETGFMSNPIEGMVLTNDNYQYWMAQGIADGIKNYFASNY